MRRANAPDADSLEKIAIAAAFHDLGIWTDHAFDYLTPSVKHAKAYLGRHDRAEWTAEIAEMICQHHKVSAYAGAAGSLVEPFRRADWIDVTRGFQGRVRNCPTSSCAKRR